MRSWSWVFYYVIFSIPSGITTLTEVVIVPVKSITAFLPLDVVPFEKVNVAPVVAFNAIAS